MAAKELRVLTVVKTMKDGDVTYNLLSNDMVHVNNHVKNKRSLVINSPMLAEMVRNS